MPTFSDFGNRKIAFLAKDGKKIVGYVGRRVARAFDELANDPQRHKALLDVFESFYRQGKKDGWREIFEEADKLKSRFNYLNPGQPKKRKTSN
jgi:hypothetical protein